MKFKIGPGCPDYPYCLCYGQDCAECLLDEEDIKDNDGYSETIKEFPK